MPRNSIALVWLAGIVATFAVYAIGPDRVVHDLGYAIAHFGDLIDDLARQFIYGAFDAMRALALGLFGVFVVLCLLAHRRGIRSVRTLVVVSVLYLALIGAFAFDDDIAGPRHWLAAFVLAAIGAAVMTRRLSGPTAVVPVAGWTPR